MSKYRMHRLEDGSLVRIMPFNGFDGFEVRWTDECTGCTEREDGHLVGRYPFDEKAKCYVGNGCHECGYTGKRRRAEWVPIDMDAYLERDRQTA